MTVYVCPRRDIECGQNPKHWCHECPQMGHYVAPSYDIERMEKALREPSVMVPDSLQTPAEIGAFILGAAAAFEAARTSSPPLMKEEE